MQFDSHSVLLRPLEMLGSGCPSNLFLGCVLYGKLMTCAPASFCPLFPRYSCAKTDNAHLLFTTWLFCSSPCLKAKVLIFAGFLMVLVWVCCKQKGNHFASRFLKWRAGCCPYFIDCNFRYVRLRSKDFLEYLWNTFYFTITLGLQTWFWLLLLFLEYLENKVLHDFKCSPLEYVAIFASYLHGISGSET